jgi:hypothetical protein
VKLTHTEDITLSIKVPQDYKDWKEILGYCGNNRDVSIAYCVVGKTEST